MAYNQNKTEKSSYKIKDETQKNKIKNSEEDLRHNKTKDSSEHEDAKKPSKK